LTERWSIEIGDLTISNVEKDRLLRLKSQDFAESLHYKTFTLQLTKGRFRYLSVVKSKDLIKDFTMTLIVEVK
jgi:hypothetical protein